MRILALAILAVMAVFAAGSVGAQTYDPNYPVCMTVYGRGGNFIECSYASLAQCAASASGRAAQCTPNPYFAYAYAEPPLLRHKRLHRVE